MAGKKNGQTSRGIMGSPYRSYVWRGDKDDAIYQLRTAMQDSGVTNSQLHAMSNVSITTFHNWFEGPTIRPSNAAIEAAFRALGYERVPRRIRAVDVDSEVDAGKRWIERYKRKNEQQKEK